MARRKRVMPQNTFLWGGLKAGAGGRPDSELYLNGAVRFENVEILATGGYRNRRATPFVHALATRVVEAEFRPDPDLLFYVEFEPTKALIYDETDVLVATLTSAPWTAAEIPTLSWTAQDNEMEICHKDMANQLIKRTSAGVWSLAAKVYSAGVDDEILQPYWRFQDKGVGLTPSALTGSITLTTSADHWVTGHVGVRVRYLGREIDITAFTSATVVTGTVIQTLPPTHDVVVASGAGFGVGEVVEGDVSNATGVVTAVVSTTVTVLMITGYEGFDAAEELVGPNTKSTVTSSTPTTAAAALDWDEQMFSSVRGYPGFVFTHNQRRGYCDHKTVPLAFLMSAPLAPDNFDTGEANDDEAIVTALNFEKSSRIISAVSSDTLIVLTDGAAFYVPEGGAPITPSSFDFKRITPAGASECKPVAVKDGVIYIESAGNRAIGLVTTGDVQRPWRDVELSQHTDYVVSPSRLIFPGDAANPERYVYAVNNDGTVAVLHFVIEPLSIGWALWNNSGTIEDIAEVGNNIYFMTQRTIDGSLNRMLEKGDASSQLDASVTFETAPAATASHLAGETIYVRQGVKQMGTHLVAADGSIPTLDTTGGGFEAGLHYDMVAEPWPAAPEDDERIGFATRRLIAMAVKSRQTSQFKVGGQLKPAHVAGIAMGSAPVLTDETTRFKFLGRSHDPTQLIERPAPSPVEILSVQQQIGY